MLAHITVAVASRLPWAALGSGLDSLSLSLSLSFIHSHTHTHMHMHTCSAAAKVSLRGVFVHIILSQQFVII